MLQRQLFCLSSAIVLSGLLTCAQAVELGEPLVRSHLGQPLSADIELTGIASDAASVQAALADPDVYRGASISMHPALASLNMTIVRRDGRRFLHIASPRTIDTEFVNLFFALTENGRQAVRATTLWFTPDPNPAPPPPAVSPPAPVAAAPTAAARPAAAAPAAVPVMRAPPRAVPAACTPRFSAAQIGACTALDSKNAALSARIVELEDKVKVLTKAMHAPEPAARTATKAVLAKVAPARPAAVQAAKPAGTTPWLFIGIASALVLVLAAVLVLLLRPKRKAVQHAKAKAAVKAPGFIASVRDRLLPAKKEVEPEVEAQATAG